MTFVEIIDLFAFYGVDVVVLAAATSALTQVLKTTLLKNANPRVYAFLPFILGVVLYSAYVAAGHLGFEYLAQNLPYCLQQGLMVGGAATSVYVIYEQFKKGSSSPADAIKVLISGMADEEKEQAAAEEILKGEKDPAEILKELSPDEDERVLKLIAALIEKLPKKR